MDHFLILVSIFFTTAGQLLQKIAATKAAAMSPKSHFLKRILIQHETWWAFVSLAVGTILWLVVLYRMEVSKAFPFLSIGLVLVILVSRYHLKEIISDKRWVGLGLIGTGIVLISQS